MSSVTRHALRVYAALAELKAPNADILDALVPFLEPILEVMNGKLFNPRLLAAGVGKMYRWRFTGDVAEQFIPRLERMGYLKRSGNGRQAAYIVTFAGEGAKQQANTEIDNVLSGLLDEFVSFIKSLGDSNPYRRNRDQLADILIRFLVSTDAFGGAPGTSTNGAAELEAGETEALKKIEEGGRPLSDIDRYVAARFVQHLTNEKSIHLPGLARLASIGLLTEVVEDFVKPTSKPQVVDLTVILDAPLALDYLGLSGKVLQDDVRFVVEALGGIGCKTIVLSNSCSEMRRNLKSMLNQDRSNRHGYTHQAMLRGEVDDDYVQSVANNPEGALEGFGIEVRTINSIKYPNIEKYFDQARLDDFYSYVTWVTEPAPRDHDAACMALTMRLRQDRHNNDLLRCGYVFVTRNPAFARRSREYSLQSRLINERQEGPVVHQRELATVAWLRTGLGADGSIPTAHLVAWCDRVLRVRPEVTERVAARLRAMTPEKMQQYELLLRDHRSVRRLADATLNDESVITDESAQELLDMMRRATAEEERAAYESEMQLVGERHAEEKRQVEAKAAAAQREAEAKAAIAIREREELLNAERAVSAQRFEEIKRLEIKLGTQGEREIAQIDAVSRRVNRKTRMIFKGASWILIVIGILAVVDALFFSLNSYFVWKVIIAVGSGLGLYHLITDVLQVPKYGMRTILDYLAGRLLESELREPALRWLSKERFCIKDGIVSRKHD